MGRAARRATRVTMLGVVGRQMVMRRNRREKGGVAVEEGENVKSGTRQRGVGQRRLTILLIQPKKKGGITLPIPSGPI
jgi:hypothetical protein